ncbi:hypothetical protein DV36_01340 [Amycolatopsis mediterranei]|nr:hypothetical protein DV36_01340 [Amycolatopsis mediterranei]
MPRSGEDGGGGFGVVLARGGGEASIAEAVGDDAVFAGGGEVLLVVSVYQPLRRKVAGIPEAVMSSSVALWSAASRRTVVGACRPEV